LTARTALRSIVRMKLETLHAILDDADGVEGGDGRWEVEDDHRMTFYLGEAGQAMTIADVEKVSVAKGIVTLDRGDEGKVYAETEGVCAVAVKPSPEATGRRAGFA